tara:strand:+ start:127 stop:351 length:225 start_codon:yes stop_codon:yes gene_type:complete
MTPEERKEYYLKNKKKRLEYQKRYYELNKGKIRKKLEERKADDPTWVEKQRAYNREYYRKNRTRIRQSRTKMSG